MRRADRLFQIIQIMRRARAPITADTIAGELETSKRTVYRDIATLMGQRVPIRGEAGMGYVLDHGFDLPPLMLTPDEIEAAVLGAAWNADATQILTWSLDGSVRTWDAFTGAEIMVGYGSLPPYYAEWINDGGVLTLAGDPGSEDGLVTLWNADGTVRAELSAGAEARLTVSDEA